MSIGFEPRYFEFGIGRNAFRPLSESDWSNGVGSNVPNFRIIGIADGDEAHAYSVSKLARHEIANAMLASENLPQRYNLAQLEAEISIFKNFEMTTTFKAAFFLIKTFSEVFQYMRLS